MALLKNAGRNVRPVSRSTAIPFDWHDEATWGPALRDASHLYVTYQPDLAVPGAAAAIQRLCAAAGHLEHIVLLAGRGEPQVHPAEEALRQCGIAFTILEAAFFAQNFTEGLLVPRDGVVHFPSQGVREPFIDCRDIAEAAFVCFSDPKHRGQTYELTGPELLTFAEACTLLGNVRCIDPGFETFQGMLETQMPKDEAAFLTELFRFLTGGHNAHLTGTLPRLLGRPATPLRDVIARASESTQEQAR